VTTFSKVHGARRPGFDGKKDVHETICRVVVQRRSGGGGGGGRARRASVRPNDVSDTQTVFVK